MLPRFLPTNYFLTLLVAILLLTNADAKAADNDENKTIIRFGVFAYLGKEKTESKYKPLVDCINRRLIDEKIILEVLPEEEIDKRIANGTLEIVTTNPTHYLVARKKQPHTAVLATLVGVENSEPIYRLGGTIIARSDRDDINTLKDIKNKKVGIVGFNNLGAYRSQAYELKKANVAPESLKITQHKTQQSVIASVAAKKTDVGFVKNGVLEDMIKRGEINGSSLKVINKQNFPNFPHAVSTRLYPEWPVFALPHAPQSAVRHIATALYEIEPESRTAKTAGIYGYTIPADYAEIEELSRTLRLPPFDHAPSFTALDVWDKYQIFLIIGLAFVFIIAILSVALLALLSKSKKETALKELLLSSLGSGVYGVNAKGDCIFINNAALKMIGYTKEEVIGTNQHLLFHHHRQNGDEYDEKDCPIYKTSRDGIPRETEEIFIDKHGRFIEIYLKVTPLHEAQEDVGAVVVFEDISQRKQLERELLSINQNLQAMVIEETEKNMAKERLLIQQSKMAMMGDMIAAIAHQWKQPLNVIYLLCQELHFDYESNDVDSEYIKNFRNKTADVITQMIKTMEDFRSFFRPTNTKERFDIKSAWEQAFIVAEPALKAKFIKTTFSQTEDIYIDGYKNELAQVIMILLQNAKDALIERQIDTPLITIEVKNIKECAAIYIEDNGGGIDEDIIDKIFDYYFTTKDEQSGTGIGLYMAKEIIESHMNGIIKAENGVLGARFEILIPLANSTT